MQNIPIFVLVIILLAGCVSEQKESPATNKDPAAAPKAMPKTVAPEITESAKPPSKIPVAAIPPVAINTRTEEIPIKQEEKIVTVPPPIAPPPSIVPPPQIINGKTQKDRLLEAQDRLHTFGSGRQIRQDFPDIELVHTDYGNNTGFPLMILPFRYYYSKESNKTFNICNIDLTVFICEGKLNRLIIKDDIETNRCKVTPVYMSDPRIGGSGGSGYGYYQN